MRTTFRRYQICYAVPNVSRHTLQAISSLSSRCVSSNAPLIVYQPKPPYHVGIMLAFQKSGSTGAIRRHTAPLRVAAGTARLKREGPLGPLRFRFDSAFCAIFVIFTMAIFYMDVSFGADSADSEMPAGESWWRWLGASELADESVQR